jgi:hypothetical protein
MKAGFPTIWEPGMCFQTKFVGTDEPGGYTLHLGVLPHDDMLSGTATDNTLATAEDPGAILGPIQLLRTHTSNDGRDCIAACVHCPIQRGTTEVDAVGKTHQALWCLLSCANENFVIQIPTKLHDAPTTCECLNTSDVIPQVDNLDKETNAPPTAHSVYATETQRANSTDTPHVWHVFPCKHQRGQDLLQAHAKREELGEAEACARGITNPQASQNASGGAATLRATLSVLRDNPGLRSPLGNGMTIKTFFSGLIPLMDDVDETMSENRPTDFHTLATFLYHFTHTPLVEFMVR